MQKPLLRLFTISVILSFAVYSCTTETDDMPEPDGGGGNGIKDTTAITLSDTCSPDTVYFVADVYPIIQSNCAMSGCHDANSKQVGVQLTDYDHIVKTAGVVAGDPAESELYEVITSTDPTEVMPPKPGSLSSEQKNAIRLWILQGANNNSCRNICDTTNITFSKNVWPIINTTCGGCHAGGSPQGGVPIRNYSDLKVLVDNGHLISVLKRDGVRKPMPPGGPIEDCAMRQVQAWINDGARDN